MSKIMLVNVTHVEESRVAVLENGVLAQYEIETLNRANIKGNIYNAVVENVHGALEAAFLRLTGELKGFLPLDEVNFRLLPNRGDSRARGRIGQHLHAGQKLMVQVVREPFAGKPPTVSTYFSFPGRYLVLMPGVDAAGVSRKIEDAEQRDRLRKLVEELNPPEGFGLIVRTAGLGQSRAELQRDLRYLLRLWESIQRGSRAGEFPGLVYRERDLVIRTIRDFLTPDVDEVWIDSKETHDRALEFVRDVMPNRAKILKLHTGDRPLFSKFNLEEQIESIYKRRVPLPSGGEIVIDGTEALTAIDVNSARSSRQGDAEEIATATNLEAAAEIARQLRLRDLGGLIVVDFIDMLAARNQKKVEKAMKDALKSDRAKYDVTRISKLGLMEVSRQRIKGEKIGASYATCPACEGYGLIKNVESASLSALRKLQTRCLRGDFGRVRMGVPPEVAHWILNNKREDLVQMERRLSIRVLVEPKAALLRHEAEFEFFPREKSDEAAVPMAEKVAAVPAAPPEPPESAEPASPDDSAALPTAADSIGSPQQEAIAAEGRKRRRRRRRRGRGGDAPVPTAAEEEAEALAALIPEEDDGAVSPPLPLPLPQEPPMSTVESSNGTVSGTSSGEDGPGRRRRRRRRRRRGRGGAGIADLPEASAPPDTAESRREPPPYEALPEETTVPRGVRADVLMPAATGDLQRSETPGRKWRGRSGHHRRGTGRGKAGGGGGGVPPVLD